MNVKEKRESKFKKHWRLLQCTITFRLKNNDAKKRNKCYQCKEIAQDLRQGAARPEDLHKCRLFILSSSLDDNDRITVIYGA